MTLSMRPLVKDEAVHLDEDGPGYVVSRVSPCAAYLTRTWRQVVTKTDRKGEAHTFTATGRETVAVSLTAALWR